MQQVRQPMLVGCMLARLGTSTTAVLAHDRGPRAVEQTSAGASVPMEKPAGPAIAELRRRSGLTWEQLARLFGVSRRSLHFWASGKPMAPTNEEHLQRLLAAMRKVDRGSAAANRSALLSAREDESIPFDLLAVGDYEQVVKMLGEGEGRRARPSRRADEAAAARLPRPPEELVSALQDRIQPASGRLLAAKPLRIPRGK